MVKQIIWSFQAQKDRKEILQYWRSRNKSNAFSIKLNGLFKDAIKLIAAHPQLGRKTEFPGIRVKIVRDYLIIYKATPKRIEILTIWDTRRNPDELERKMK